MEAFDRLDADDTGYITKKNLRDLFGADYDEQLVDRMIAEADEDKDGNINYQDFLLMMRKRRRKSIHQQTAAGAR